MDKLATSQSDLLGRLFISSIPYSSLTDDEISICDFLKSLDYVSFSSSFNSMDDGGCYQFYESIDSVSITELGKMYLVNERLSDEQQRYLKEQLDSLRAMSESAKKQSAEAIKSNSLLSEKLEIAKEEVASANKEALFSRSVSILALIVSLLPYIAHIVQVLWPLMK